MGMLSHLLWDNPVLTREFRVRMRGTRAMWLVFGYVALLSAAMVIALAFWTIAVRNSTARPETATIGSTMFGALATVQSILVIFITPAITSGAITIEREQQTLDLVLISGLSPSSIVTGKMLAGACFSILLTFTTLPLFALCQVLGGVDANTVLSFFLVLSAYAAVMAAMGILWSSIARSTMLAVLSSYTSVMILIMVYLSARVVILQSAVGMALFTLQIALGMHPESTRYTFGNTSQGLIFYLNVLFIVVLMCHSAVLYLDKENDWRALIHRALTSLFILWITARLTLGWFDIHSNVNMIAQAHFGATEYTNAPLIVIISGIVLFTILFATSNGYREFHNSQLDPRSPHEGVIRRWANSDALRFFHVVVTAALMLAIYLAGHFIAHVREVPESNLKLLLLATLFGAAGLSLFCILLSRATCQRWAAMCMALTAIIVGAVIGLTSTVESHIRLSILYLHPFAVTYFLFQPTAYISDTAMPTSTQFACIVCTRWLIVSIAFVAFIAVGNRRRSRATSVTAS